MLGVHNQAHNVTHIRCGGSTLGAGGGQGWGGLTGCAARRARPSDRRLFAHAAPKNAAHDARRKHQRKEAALYPGEHDHRLASGLQRQVLVGSRADVLLQDAWAEQRRDAPRGGAGTVRTRARMCVCPASSGEALGGLPSTLARHSPAPMAHQATPAAAKMVSISPPHTPQVRH